MNLTTTKLGWRLWQCHLLMIIPGFIAFATNDFTKTNKIITAVATVFFLGILFIMCYNEANRCAQNDRKYNQEGGPWKGLLAGLLASVPGLAVLGLSFLVPVPAFLSFFPTFPEDWYRVYMVVYEGLLSFTGDGLWIKLSLLLTQPLVSMIGYLTGRHNKNLMEQMQTGVSHLVYEQKK